MSKSLERKDLKLLAFNYLAIMCAVVLYSWMMKWPAALALMIVGLVSFVVRKPIRFGILSWFFAALITVAAMTLFKYLFPIPSNRMMSLLYPELYTPAFLGVAIMCLFFEQTGLNVGMSILLSYVGMIMAGAKGMGFGYEHEIFFSGTVVYIVSILQVAKLLRSNEKHHKRASRKEGIGTRVFVTASVFILALVMVLPISRIFFNIYNYLEAKVYNVLRFKPPAGQLSSSLNMWNTPPKDWDQESEVVMRVRSDVCPQYMRGYVFEEYRQGRWLRAAEQEAILKTSVNERFNRFSCVPPERVDGDTVNIQVAKGLMGSNVLLAPGDTSEIKTMASSIQKDRNNAFFPDYTDRKDGGSYDLKVVPSSDPAYSGPEHMADSERRYLQVPENLSSVLNNIAQEIMDGHSVYDMPETEIRSRLALYFMNNCEYELGVKFDLESDPIKQFLTEKKKGHCTLFASASVLLLRSMGIPARVVTGYICMEKHPSGGYWLSRVNCAHAWAEAYSKKEARWILVENTPASSIQTGESHFNFITSIADYLSWHWRSLIAALKTGGIRAAWVQLAKSLSAAVAWLVSNLLLMIFIILSISVQAGRKIYFRYLRDRQKALTDEQTRILIRTLKRIEDRLMKLGITRKPHVTISEHINRVRQSNIEGTESLADLLVSYQSLRYQQQQRTMESVREFDSSVAAMVRNYGRIGYR